MNISKKLVLALASTGLVAPMAASAQEIAAVSGRAAVNEYMQQQDIDTFRAWESRNQVTSVNQFSDVKPTDWAYQALSNLVEKYGCVAGYPDGKFKGSQAMSRFEAAALLNACLDRVTEKTDELQKLLDEFDKELTVLTARVDGLESKVGKLQAQQFSTTTKLKGEVSMILGGIPGYGKGNPNTAGGGNTTFNYDMRLSLDTSYTGQDLLRTRLRSGNFSRYPFGTSSNNPFKLDKAESYNDVTNVDRLYYQFPLGKDNQFKVTVGALVRNTEMAWIASAYKSDVLDVYALGGTSGVYNKATGQGAGIQWQQKVEKGKPAFVANVNYVVSGTCVNSGKPDAKTGANAKSTCSSAGQNGSAGADSSAGIFNSESGINIMAQLGYKGPNYGAAFGYRYGTQGSAMRSANFLAGSALYGGQTSNSIALNAYWQPIKTGWFPSISAGYGYNFISGDVKPIVSSKSLAPLGSSSWMVGLQWNDAFVKSNTAGIAFGQPANVGGSVYSSPWLIEWFYKIQATDNITITPTLFYGSNIRTTAENSAGTAQGFNGLGGVIQTTFRF
jgi:hypothetical protein